MKPTPSGWPRISSALFYDDPLAAIDWLERAFGFETRIKVVDDQGALVHSELTYGDGVIMVSSSHRPSAPDDQRPASPKSLGGKNTQSLFMYVDDVDAHCATARAAGAKILRDPTDVDYGPEHWADRGYEAEDPEGHRWWFATRIRG